MKSKTKNQNSQTEFSFEPLIDLKLNGKKRNWDKQKKMSLAVSDAYFKNPDLIKFGERMRACATFMEFNACPIIEHGKVLTYANFCKLRQCVTCQGRKSSIIRTQTVDVTREHLKRRKTDVPILITLTAVNEPGETVGQLIDRKLTAWSRLMKLAPVKRAVTSWFRSVEIPYNPERDDYHPHIHAVVMVPQSYFRKNSELYLERDVLLRLWQKSMRDDRITQVDIRRIKKKEMGELESFVGEAAKYATKPSSYILESKTGNYEASPKVVRDLHFALRGRRLVAYGGLFNKIRKEQNMADVEKSDLVDSDCEADSKKCGCKVCERELVKERYGWGFGVNQYCKIPVRSQESEDDVEDAEVVYEAAFPEKENESFCDHDDTEVVSGEDSSDVTGESSLSFKDGKKVEPSQKPSFEDKKVSLVLLRNPP